MEKVPTLAGEKYEPEIFSFDPFYAQARLSMSEILAQAERQVEALSIMSEEESRDVPVWKIALLVVVSASVGLALRQYYVKRRGDTPGGEQGKQTEGGEPSKQEQEAKKPTEGQMEKLAAEVESKVDPKQSDSGL